MDKKPKYELMTEQNQRYNKEQIINSKKYEKHIDILQAILKDSNSYTVEEVDKIIKDFMERKV